MEDGGMNIIKRSSKISRLILIIIMLVVLLGVTAPANALSVPSVTLDFGQNVISKADAIHKISFILGEQLTGNATRRDNIVITFPEGYSIGGTVTGTIVAGPGWVTDGIGIDPEWDPNPPVLGVNFTSNPAFRTITYTLDDTNDYIGQSAEVRIQINTGITNPNTPGDYTLDVATQMTDGTDIEAAVTSAAYLIVAPYIYPLAGIVSAYNSAGILMTQSHSINTGIAAAGPGGRVEVGPGTYSEDVIANQPGQTIIGTGALGTVVINDYSGFSGGTLAITAGEYISGSKQGVTIDGITIKPGFIIPENTLVTIESSANYATITNCVVTSGVNSAITALGEDSTITNCEIITKQNGQFGIIAGITAYNVEISECTFNGNSGTGIRIDADGVSASKNMFTGLTTAVKMGGTDSTLISDNTILGNECGITLEVSGNNTIVNNVISKNSTNGIELTAGSNGNTLVNNTVVSNFITGIYADGTSTGNLLSNSIICDNGDDINGIAATNSDIGNGDAGAGNISVDPMFVNLSGDDYHLQTGSPCIDSGNNTYAITPTDFEGNPRILDGDLDLMAIVDMGADEYSPADAGLIGSINFHGVELGSYLELDTVLENTGIVPFTVENVTRTAGSELFTVISPLSPVSVLPGESVNITIRFSPVSETSSSAVFGVDVGNPLNREIDFETEGYGVIVLGGTGGIRGDVNGDGEVNVLDMTAIARIILGLE